jgi:hypothetical protein
MSVESEGSVSKGWQAALDISMRKHHPIRPTADIVESLLHDDLSRYNMAKIIGNLIQSKARFEDA